MSSEFADAALRNFRRPAPDRHNHVIRGQARAQYCENDPLERIPITFEHNLHAGRSSCILVG
jgi:hypothetical protein